MRFARQSRQAGNDDNVVELTRPLGLVLNQDDDGNVYVETVAPRGNAARTGKVCILKKCSLRELCIELAARCALLLIVDGMRSHRQFSLVFFKIE